MSTQQPNPITHPITPIAINVGSRKSKLALTQTNIVIQLLYGLYGSDKYRFNIETIETKGDINLDIPLSKIGAKSLFTGDLEQKLQSDEIDFVVHSLKDMPTVLPHDCCIAAIIKREDPTDALVLKEGLRLENVNESVWGDNWTTIGTSSVRRIAQLKHLNANLNIIDIRGNLDTRLSKLDDINSKYSALILASSGLKRAGYQNRISKTLTENWFYAVGQGAIAVECKTNNSFIIDLLNPISDEFTTLECIAERSLMAQLEGGCSVPIAVRTKWSDNQTKLTLYGAVYSLDGKQKVENQISQNLNQVNLNARNDKTPQNITGVLLRNDKILVNKYLSCNEIGLRLADILLESGAKHILETIKIA